MPRIVELQYNPYVPSLRILVDGGVLPQYSALIQYCDEDIRDWYRFIAGTLQEELRDTYEVIFTGTPQDAEITEAVFREELACIRFSAREFPISEPLQSRMQRLNRYIQENDVHPAAEAPDIAFLLMPGMRSCAEDILGLEVRNRYCRPVIHLVRPDETRRECGGGWLILLAAREDSVELMTADLRNGRQTFVIRLGNRTGLQSVTEQAWIYESTPEQLFQTIFDCLLQGPLMSAFRSCRISLLKERAQDPELLRIGMVEPRILVRVDSRIEAGTGAMLTAEPDPPLGRVPNLILRPGDPTILACSGMRIIGLRAGTTELEVFQEGDQLPISVQTITVYTRNRIRNLLLSEDSIVMGVGDAFRLGCDHVPADADNVREITWESSDPGVAAVDSHGTVTAVRAGTCRIICTAERVSVSCRCTVKHRLQEIRLDPEPENGEMVLRPMSETPLKAEGIPADSIDGRLIICSADCNVVNAVKGILYAKSGGETVITVKNESGSVSRSFRAVISRVHTASSKSGFFRKLFQRREEG